MQYIAQHCSHGSGGGGGGSRGRVDGGGGGGHGREQFLGQLQSGGVAALGAPSGHGDGGDDAAASDQLLQPQFRVVRQEERQTATETVAGTLQTQNKN